MPQAISIPITGNATQLYDEIIRQARRAEAAVKKIPLRIETKDLGGFKTLTADIDRFDKSVSRMSAVITTFGQAAAIIFGIQNAFAAMVKTSIKVEKQLNDINAIFNASNNTMKQFSDGLFEVAKQTGQSFDVAATAAQEFARQGLTVEQTLKRTRDALTLTRISGLDAASATESLTAILNTFNKEALDSTRITNILANVDTKFAVSAADLTEALKRAGASASDAKVPFNELVAAVTSLQQSTARGGSVIGNSLKSIFTRLQRGSTVDALREIGVEVRDAEGNLKPMLKTLEDLSKKFYGLSDATQASIKEQVAGVYQINQLSALLADLSSGYSTYDKALRVANGTQNEAAERLKALKDVTAGSLNDTLANLTKFAAESGKIVINPIVKNSSDFLNSFFSSSDGAGQGETMGQKIGEGLLEGIGSYLSSGGAVIIGKALFNISRLVAVGVKDQVIAATTLGRSSEKQLYLQEQIKSVMLSTDPIIQNILRSATSEADKRQQILNILQKQEASLLHINALSAKFSSQSLKEGLTGLNSSAAPRRFFKGKTAAGGYLPSMIAEKQAVNKGVGGAPRSARPVVIPNFNFGGGKRDTIIANSSEYLVPNYANGGSAIFNQEMVKNIGLPRGAKKIMAGGYVPNFFGQFSGRASHLSDFFSRAFPGAKMPKVFVKEFNKFYPGADANEYGGYFYKNKIKLNKNQSDLDLFRSLVHETGHAAENNLSKYQKSKLRTALERDIDKRGESVGESFLGSHAKSYNDSEFSESLAESALMSFRTGKPGVQKGKDSLMYRYIRRFINKRFANGYIPNFEKGELMGAGMFGSFYKLRGNIGVKRFNTRLNNASGDTIEDRINNAIENKNKAIKEEFLVGKMLSSENLIPGVTAPKIIGSLKNSLQKGRIGKEVISDPLGDNVLDAPSLIGNVLSAMFESLGIQADDLHGQNYTVNKAGSNLLNSNAGYKLALKAIRTRDPEKRTDKLFRLANKFSRKGGKINIIDAGLMGTPTGALDQYSKAGGYVPNFNPLLASAQREASSLQDLGYTKEQIFKSLKVQSSGRLKNKNNPGGLGVFNTLQGQNTIGQALSDHSGENLHKSGIPNFSPSSDYRSVRKTLQEIGGGVRQPGASGLPKLFDAASIQNLSKEIDGMSKNTKLFNKAAPILVNKFNKEISQIDKVLAVGNLSIKAESALNSQKKLLSAGLGKVLDKSSSNLNLIRNPIIQGALTTRNEENSRSKNERISFLENEKLKEEERREKKSVEKDRIRARRQDRLQSTLLASSLASPFLGEFAGRAFGDNEKSRGNRISTGIANSASTALALSTLGPAGVAAGVGVAGYGLLSSTVKSRPEFAGQENTTIDIQRELDKSQKLQTDRGGFQDSFLKFADATGFGKVRAEDDLKKSISSIDDDILKRALTKLSLDSDITKDQRILGQNELFGQAEADLQVSGNIAASREFFARIVDGTGLLSRLNGQLDFVPSKLKDFTDLLTNTVSDKELKGATINGDFINEIIKRTGLDLDKFKGNPAIDAAKDAFSLGLRKRQSESKFFDEAKEIEKKKAFARTEKVGTGKALFDRASLASSLNRKSLFDQIGTRLESPVFSDESKAEINFGVKQKEIASAFQDGLEGIQREFIGLSKTDEGSKIADLLKDLTNANLNGDVSGSIDLIKNFKGFNDTDGNEAQKELVKKINELVQINSAELDNSNKIREIQQRNEQDKKLLEYFSKSGLKGAENLGRKTTAGSISLLSAEQELKNLEKLPSDSLNKKERIEAARVKVSQARIDEFKSRQDRGQGPKDNEAKLRAKSSLLFDVQNVTESNLKTDLLGVLQSAGSGSIGSKLTTPIENLRKIISTGSIQDADRGISAFEKQSKTSFSNYGIAGPESSAFLQKILGDIKEFQDQRKNSFSIAETKASEIVGISDTKASGSDAKSIEDKLTDVTGPSLALLNNSVTSYESTNAALIVSLGNYATETKELARVIAAYDVEKNKLEQDKFNSDKRIDAEELINKFNVQMDSFVKNNEVTFEENARAFLKNPVDVTTSIRNDRRGQINYRVSSDNSETLTKTAPELEKALSEIITKLKKLGITFDDFQQMSREQQIVTLSSNFDPYASAIRRAKNKEVRAGIPANQIYTDTDKRLISPTNPMGLMVANYLDEPNGGYEGVDRKIKRGLNPKLNESGVPNFAELRVKPGYEPKPYGKVADSRFGGYNPPEIPKERILSPSEIAEIERSKKPRPKSPLELGPSDKPAVGDTKYDYLYKDKNIIPKSPSSLLPSDKPVAGDTRFDYLYSKKPTDIPTVPSGSSVLESEEKRKREQLQIIENFRKRKEATGRFDSSGKFRPPVETGPLYGTRGGVGLIDGRPSSFYTPAQQGIGGRSNPIQKPSASIPKSISNPQASSSPQSDMNANSVAELKNAISNVAISVKNESRRALRLDINGTSSSVKDFQEMEDRVFGRVVDYIAANRYLDGDKSYRIG